VSARFGVPTGITATNVARVAPGLPKDRVDHWERVIARETEAGLYTGARMWAIAGEIMAELKGLRDE
jgi:hypothetical protein